VVFEDAPERAAADCRAFLERFEATLSRFRPDSELCTLNAHPSATVPVSPLLRVAVAAGLWAAARTHGLVDPTLVGELEAAGYAASRLGPEHPLAEALAGARHVARTLVLRQMVIACALTLVAMGFSETVIFAIVDDGLHRAPSFVGVLMATQGIGAVAGGLTAARVDRRLGEGRLAGLGMALVAAGALLMTSPALAVVLPGKVLFGVGGPWIVVAVVTLLQRRTPGHLQGRVYSAADLLLGVPQTASIAGGAVLLALVGYRWLLLAEAAATALAAAYLLTRSAQQALRGARELEDDAGLGVRGGGHGLGLGDDGAHAVERLGQQGRGGDAGDLHAGEIGAPARVPEGAGARVDG
jgi:hypothetical protein